MTCQACADPDGWLLQAGCRACSIRDIARGPAFFESMRANKLSDRYKAVLRTLGDVAEVHAEVREAAKKYATGARG